MVRHWQKAAWVGLVLVLGGAARAADVEVRDFGVYVDGKPAGSTQYTFENKGDGVTDVTCRTNVLVKVLFVTYKYEYQGQEIWKNGRLQGFASRCNDDGKRFGVQAALEESGIRVKVNGRDTWTAKPEVWLTTYATLPDAKLRDGDIPLLDADNGEEMSCRLTHISTEKLSVAGTAVDVEHYRINGKRPVDVWYDGSGRMVRRDGVEDGHRVIVQLTRVRR